MPMCTPIWLAIFAILALAPNAYACDVIAGTWISDREASLKYASENTKASENDLAFIRQAFGHLRVSYSVNHYKMHESEDISVVLDGQSYPFKFEQLISPIQYISCSQAEVTYLYQDHLGNTENNKVYFIDQNRLWLEVDNVVEREYFVREE